MGASDRDYFRDEEKRYSRVQTSWPKMTPVTKALLISNIALFLIDFFSRQAGENAGILNRPLCFAVESAFMEFRLWELLTFQFLHLHLLHLLANCVGLFLFGAWAENWWGSRRFLIFYLGCGIFGALAFTGLALSGVLPSVHATTPMVGASAGVFGLMACVARINPKEKIRLLFPPVELTMRNLAAISLGFAAVVILADIALGGRPTMNSGGEAAHLGGALLGYLLTRHPAVLKRGRDRKIIHPPEFRRRKSKPKLRPRTEIVSDAACEVDRILDKISRDGVQSLSKAERETLQRAGNTPKDR